MRSMTDLFSTKILAFAARFFLLHTFVVAAEAAGFREMSVDDLNLGVWYPSDTSPSRQRLGPFDVEIAKNVPIRAGKYEIVLFSHGNGGSYRNHHLTTRTLADAGFIVVAPQHEADYLVGGKKQPQRWITDISNYLKRWIPFLDRQSSVNMPIEKMSTVWAIL